MKKTNNTKSSTRTTYKVANDLGKLAAKLAKQVSRMTEDQRLAAMQILGNSDDAAGFDAVVAARTANKLADQMVFVFGTEVASENIMLLASFTNNERRAKAVQRSAIHGGRFTNVYLDYAVVR